MPSSAANRNAIHSTPAATPSRPSPLGREREARRHDDEQHEQPDRGDDVAGLELQAQVLAGDREGGGQPASSAAPPRAAARGRSPATSSVPSWIGVSRTIRPPESTISRSRPGDGARHVVQGHHQDALRRGELLEELGQRGGGRLVESRVRLVEQDHGGVVQQRAGERDPLPGAAGESADRLVEHVVHVEALGRALDRLRRLRERRRACAWNRRFSRR